MSFLEFEHWWLHQQLESVQLINVSDESTVSTRRRGDGGWQWFTVILKSDREQQGQRTFLRIQLLNRWCSNIQGDQSLYTEQLLEE